MREWRGAGDGIAQGELVVLVTDGVTDMRDPTGAMYGRARMEAVLEGRRSQSGSAREAVDALRGDVQAFAAGAEPADDLTVLAIRWNGKPGIPRSTGR